MTTASASISAICAAHGDSPAVAVCGRCGSFACDACTETRADGVRFCGSCWPASRYLPLPIDESLGPAALARTIVLWLFRPGAAKRLHSPHGIAWTSLIYLLWLGVSNLCAAFALLRVGTIWGNETPAAPFQFASDLGDWGLRETFGQVVLGLIVMALDRLILWRNSDTSRLLRASIFTLTPLWTIWIAVGAVWLGAALFRPEPAWLGTIALLLTFVLPLWLLAGFVMWLVWRWRLLAWASDSRGRAMLAALLSPVLAIAGAFALA